MKTITITAEEQDLNLFAQATGYKQGDINEHITNTISGVFKNAIKSFVVEQTAKTIREQSDAQLEAIEEKEISVTIQ